jgi:hypothetical protein
MRRQLPLVLSATALITALLGSTQLGRAAGNVIEQIVPHAKLADFATNAGKLNKHKASTTPKAGQIPVLNARGKLPASIGAVGPPGPQGSQGPPGISGYQIQIEATTLQGNTARDRTVDCPGGKSVLGGGFSLAGEDGAYALASHPAGNNNAWHFKIKGATGATRGLSLYVVCANVG